jgi:hypothetical protein
MDARTETGVVLRTRMSAIHEKDRGYKDQVSRRPELLNARPAAA